VSYRSAKPNRFLTGRVRFLWGVSCLVAFWLWYLGRSVRSFPVRCFRFVVLVFFPAVALSCWRWSLSSAFWSLSLLRGLSVLLQGSGLFLSVLGRWLLVASSFGGLLSLPSVASPLSEPQIGFACPKVNDDEGYDDPDNQPIAWFHRSSPFPVFPQSNFGAYWVLPAVRLGSALVSFAWLSCFLRLLLPASISVVHRVTCSFPFAVGVLPFG